jgi:hypothetical protein
MSLNSCQIDIPRRLLESNLSFLETINHASSVTHQI